MTPERIAKRPMTPYLLLDNCVKNLRLPRKKLQSCLLPLMKKNKVKQLDVVFVSSSTMRGLNRRYHDSDKVTDVLAFPYGEGYLGEIFVCADVARRQAAQRGLSFTSELVLHAVHGTLHLLGYDDHDLKTAQRMRRKEVAVLGSVGLKTDRLERSHV